MNTDLNYSFADDVIDLSSLSSSNGSIGSVNSEPSLSGQVDLAKATATLDAFAKKVLKTSIDAEALKSTVNFANHLTIKLGEEKTYKRNDQLPYTVRITKEGNVLIHLKIKVGSGAYKTAKLACVIDQGEVKPATKLTSKFLFPNRSERDRQVAKTEAESLKLFSSDAQSRIIKLFAEIERTDKPKTIMYEELATEGELEKRIKANDLSPEEKCQIVKDILQGLVEMEQKGIVHRDIKPENIVLTRDENGKLRAKIIDLALALNINSRWKHAGSPMFIAPELLNDYGIPLRQVDTKNNHKIDTYAAGVTLYELISNPEEPQQDYQSLYEWRQMAEEIFEVRNQSKNPVDLLIANMINPDPSLRLSPTQALALANQLTPNHFKTTA